MAGVGEEAQEGDLTKGPVTPAQPTETPEGRFTQSARRTIEKFDLGNTEGVLRIAQEVDRVDAQRIAEGKPSLFPTFVDRVAARTVSPQTGDQALRSSNDRRQREEGSGRFEDLVGNLPALPLEGIDKDGQQTSPIADGIAAIVSSYAPVIGQESIVSSLGPVIEGIISYKSGEERATGEVDKPWTPDQVAQFRQDLVKRGLLKEETQETAKPASEQEERDKQDPINLVAQSLESAAQTQVERNYVDIWKRHIDDKDRNRLVEFSNRRYPLAFGQSKGYSEYRGPKVGEIPVVYAILSNIHNEDYRDLVSFKERFLQNLGVLRDGQTLNDFLVEAREWPKYNPAYGPKDFSAAGPIQELGGKVFRREEIVLARIPTNIPGIGVRIYTGNNDAISISVSPEAARKVQLARTT